LKQSSSFLTAAVALTVAFFALTSVAQAPAVGPPPPKREFPAPINLQVLPKDLTGEQLHEIMEKWEGSLGAHCNTCHAADPKNIGPNGRPRLNFADDSKEEKRTARLMYKMVEDINVNYVSKVPSSEAPVTCGTCHRGHLGPEPFVIPDDDHDHDHPGAPQPPPPANKPSK
jgi:hypothetical protein